MECSLFSFSVSAEDQYYHYWFSEEQASIVYSQAGCDNFCKINGKSYWYSEAQEVYKKSNWKDAKYLGKGTYLGCYRR